MANFTGSTVAHSSRPAATPATVAAYLEGGNTQQAAARFFGCSERTIRNRLAEYRLQATAPAEPAQEPTARQTRRLHRVTRPHHMYSRPAAPTSHAPAVKRFVPIAAHLVAGPHTSWCAWDGELRPVVPGMTAIAWNQEQKRLQLAAATRQRQPSMPVVATAPSVPDVPLVAASPTALPEATAVTQPLPVVATVHNAQSPTSPMGETVRTYPRRPAPPRWDRSVLAWLRGNLFAPGPALAVLVFLAIVLLLAK